MLSNQLAAGSKKSCNKQKFYFEEITMLKDDDGLDSPNAVTTGRNLAFIEHKEPPLGEYLNQSAAVAE